jgi:hypothetical protein
LRRIDSLRLLNEWYIADALTEAGYYPKVGLAEVIATVLMASSRNVWSAARLQGKSEEWIDRSAQMYSAFGWRAKSPGQDELRCVLFLINGTVMEDHLREQVASTPLGTVRSS